MTCKNNRYTVRVPYSYKSVAHNFELHRDLVQERAKTVELLVAIREIVVAAKSFPASYQILRENELLNQDLAGILEQYGPEKK